ncbi:hypothetical protein H1R20_g6973, partial [Candolleomyces eurysporus]
MSTGQGESGAQAPQDQQPSQEGPQGGIPPSVSSNQTSSSSTTSGRRRAITDDNQDSENEEYYNGDDQFQGPQQQGPEGARMCLEMGGTVPPEVLSAITSSVAGVSARTTQLAASDQQPVIQEPVTVPLAALAMSSAAIGKDPPPHMGRPRASVRRDGHDGVMISIRKHLRPTVSQIIPLSRRGQWREWDHGVRQVLTQWRLIGFVLPLDASVAPGTPPWLYTVPTPNRSGSLTADEVSALLAWEDLDMVAREVLGLAVSAQVYRFLLGNLTRRSGSYTARDLYAVLFDRYGHGGWDSGNMVWEKAKRMVCSSADAVPGYINAYVQAAREVDESLLNVQAASMVEVMLEALPRAEFGCLLDDFRWTRRGLGAGIDGLGFEDVLEWADEALALHRQLSASLFRSGCSVRRPLPNPPCHSQSCPVAPLSRQLQAPSVAAAALVPSRAPAAGGGVAMDSQRDPQSRVPGGRFSSAVCENCNIPGHTKAQCLKPGGDRHRMGPSIERGYLADGGDAEGVELDGQVDEEVEALVASAQAIELGPTIKNNDLTCVASGDDEYDLLSCAYIPAPDDPSRPLAFRVGGELRTTAASGDHLTFVPPKPDAILWHRRLGHPGYEAVKSILRGSVVLGVDPQEADTTFKCTACIIGRFPQSPFDNHGYRFQKPGELVHIDICGPFPVRTRGCCYFIVLLDDATNFGWTCLLKSRDKAYGFFKYVEARLETLVGDRIIRVRLDGAAELCKGVLEEHFKAKGISYQVTARYAHQQNGKAERYIRTIQDKAATMMAESGLSQSFYGYAVLTAQFLLNRLPTSTLKTGLTPHEALLAIKPNMSRTRVFGCRCYPLIPPEL